MPNSDSKLWNRWWSGAEDIRTVGLTANQLDNFIAHIAPQHAIVVTARDGMCAAFLDASDVVRTRRMTRWMGSGLGAQDIVYGFAPPSLARSRHLARFVQDGRDSIET